MSPELDIDDLVRSTMRRHAADAPTTIDLDGVRARSVAITRRRRYETLAAVVTTLVVLLGLGYAASQLRTQATPVEPVPSDGLPWVAFPTFDPNGQPNGSTSIVVRSGGAERSIPAPANGATTLGWYGPGARTLVYTAGGDAVRESRLLSATVSEDGRTISAPTELEIPGLGTVTGRAYTVRGAGPVVWQPTKPNGSQGRLVLVGADLTTADIVDLPPGQPLFVTSSVIGLGSSETTRIQLVSTSTGEMTGSFDTCTRPNYQVAVSYDDSHVALSCGDGTVQLVNLGGPANPRLAAVPDAAGRGGFVGLWFDPAGGLHAATTPEMQPDYAVVNDYDYNGVSWDAAGNDVLTRVFPTPSSHVDLEYHAQKWAYTPHWVVKQPHELDLGETTGTAIVFRPEQTPTPTPTPSVSTQALPPAPSPVPWTASLHEVAGSAPQAFDVQVTVAGRTRTVDTIDNARASIVGWTGSDRRTLVWSYTQDYAGDQGIRTATFAADGTLTSGPTDIAGPDGKQLAGRPVVLPDGRLVVWRYGAAADKQRVQGTLLRYADDLATATTQKLPVGDLVFATADFVGLQDYPSDPSTITVLSRDGRTTSTTDQVGACADGFEASVDARQRFVALSCRGSDVGIVAMPIDGSTQLAITPLKPLPGREKVLATWFDATGGIRVASRDDQGRVSDFTWAADLESSGDWVLTPTQGVAYASYVDGYAVQLMADPSTAFLMSGRWTTGTVPSLELGRGTGPDSLVARPAG